MLAAYGALDDFPWKRIELRSAGEPRAFSVLRARFHKNSVILLLDGVSTRNEAETLVGAEASVPRGELPELEDGEFYQFELIGLDVWSDEGVCIGVVKGIISAGGNDVLEVHGKFGEALLPAGPSCVRSVDLEAKRIVVHLLEGLVPGL